MNIFDVCLKKNKNKNSILTYLLTLKFDYKKTMADRAFISLCKFLRIRGPSRIVFSRIVRVRTII